jgi:hypothetical protein
MFAAMERATTVMPDAPSLPFESPAFGTRRGRHAAAHSPSSAASIGLILALFVVTALGFFLRAWFIGHAPINSDEAVVGLMAHNILRGHFSTFFWGQSYGGVEPYVVAAVFGVFGQSAVTLSLAPALLSLVAVVVVWQIGRRLFGKRAGLVAGALSWIWCEASLRNATREYGFHEVELLLGLLVLLQAVRIRGAEAGGKGDRVADWLAFGALSGLGWWAAPEIVYVALPGSVFLLISLWHRRPTAAAVGRLGAAAVGFALFASPWIAASFSDGFATLRASRGTSLADNSYFDRLSTFFSHVLPMILGLRVEGAGAWEVSQGFAVVVYVVLLLALVAALVLLGVRVSKARPLVAIVVLYPLLYPAFPSSWFWNDGRYAISLTPLLALTLVGGIWTAASRNLAQWIAIGVLVAATSSTLVAFNDSSGAVTSLSTLTTWGPNPNAVAISLGTSLRAHGVEDVYAGYWVAYDLQFASSNRVLVDQYRNRRESAAVEAAPKAGWVFVGPTPADRAVVENEFGARSELDPRTTSEPALLAWLTQHHLSYSSFRSGPFRVVVPSRNVTPAEV